MCVCVCVLFEVVFRKLGFIIDMEGMCVLFQVLFRKLRFFVFFFQIFFSFLDCVKYNCFYSFDSRSTRKNEEKKTTTLKTNRCSLLHRIKSPCTMTSKATSETH